MRYYDIVISKVTGGTPYRHWTSLVNGLPDFGALQIVMDVPVTSYATPSGSAYLQVWGIGIKDVGQAADFNGMSITLSAGMAKGLPLANPKQAGVLIEGTIQQAFGNWLGTDMTVDFVIGASVGSADEPKNIVLNWRAGKPLAEAMAATLKTAFPDYQQDIAISPSLVLAHDEIGYYATLTQFATHIKQLSADIVGGDYTGIDIVVNQKTVLAYDGTTPKKPRQIVFQDMIGQPTWIEPGHIQFKCPIRADFAVGDYVQMPPSLATTSAQSLSQFKQDSLFKGSYQIGNIRHVGDFRAPMAESWVTTFDVFGPVV